MKKFLGILVLGLLWCNVGFADLIVYSKCNDPHHNDFRIRNSEIRIDAKLITISKAGIFYKIWDIVNGNDFIEANIKSDEIHARNIVKGRGKYVRFPRTRTHLKFSERLVVNTTTNEIKRYGMNGLIPTDRINFPRDFYLIQEIICDERLDKK